MEKDIREALKSMNLNELNDMSDEIADFLANQTRYDVDTVIKSINAIETTIALHYVFNAAKDRLIYDDLAQVMAHKMLTGRKDELKLRSDVPLSLSRNNVFDAYTGGEIGEGLGVALAYALNNPDLHVVCVLDDYVLNYGVVYEVLVQISRLKPNLTVVLIEEQQSLLRHYTSLNAIIKSVRISKTYTGIKKDMRLMLDSNPLSRPIFNTLVKMRDAVKETVIEPTIFKQFGMEYHGPIDGQNIGDLIRVFDLAKSLKGPNLVHVQTRLVPKSKRNLKFPAFKTDTTLPDNYKTYHEVFDEVLVKNSNDNTMVLVDTIYFGDYFAKFEQKYPNNYKITTGSPEALITMASGYAMQGFNVVLAMSATDVMDALNPLRHQFINDSVPITILLRNAGLSSNSNVFKQGLYDVDALINDFSITNPRNINEAGKILENTLGSKSLSIIRYQNTAELLTSTESTSVSGWEVLNDFDKSSDGVIFSSGTSSTKLLERIKGSGLNIGLIHCLDISTVDGEILNRVSSLGITSYVYYIESKYNVIYTMMARYALGSGIALKIKTFDLDNVSVKNSSGSIKRDNKLTIDDVLRNILER